MLRTNKSHLTDIKMSTSIQPLTGPDAGYVLLKDAEGKCTKIKTSSIKIGCYSWGFDIDAYNSANGHNK